MGISKRLSFIIIFSLCIGLLVYSSGILSIKEAYSHQLFNSASQRIGHYYVQVATDPEIPTTGQTSKIMMRVSIDQDMEVSDVPVSIRITKNNVEVDRIPQIVITNGHHEFDYKFLESGNYVFFVDLMDLYFTGKTITYTFNLSTLNPFGYIFFSLIAFASTTPFVIIGIIYFKNKKAKRERERERKLSSDKNNPNETNI